MPMLHPGTSFTDRDYLTQHIARGVYGYIGKNMILIGGLTKTFLKLWHE